MIEQEIAQGLNKKIEQGQSLDEYIAYKLKEIEKQRKIGDLQSKEEIFNTIKTPILIKSNGVAIESHSLSLHRGLKSLHYLFGWQLNLSAQETILRKAQKDPWLWLKLHRLSNINLTKKIDNANLGLLGVSIIMMGANLIKNNQEKAEVEQDFTQARKEELMKHYMERQKNQDNMQRLKKEHELFDEFYEWDLNASVQETIDPFPGITTAINAYEEATQTKKELENRQRLLNNYRQLIGDAGYKPVPKSLAPQTGVSIMPSLRNASASPYDFQRMKDRTTDAWKCL